MRKIYTVSKFLYRIPFFIEVRIPSPNRTWFSSKSDPVYRKTSERYPYREFVSMDKNYFSPGIQNLFGWTKVSKEPGISIWCSHTLASFSVQNAAQNHNFFIRNYALTSQILLNERYKFSQSHIEKHCSLFNLRWTIIDQNLRVI